MSKTGITVWMTAFCMAASMAAAPTAFACCNDHPNPPALRERHAGASENTDVICGADESAWNPVVDYDTLDDARQAAGFEMTAPKSIDGYPDISYAVIANDLIQITYHADENHYICIRKGIGSEDISGDYNVYEEQSTQTVNGRRITFKGNHGTAGLAVWSDGCYAYSIMAADLDADPAGPGTGISMDAMRALTQQVR